MFEITPDFILGFLAGFIIAVVIAYVGSMIQGYWNRMQRPFQPQTVTHKTERTPRQVIDDAGSAFYRLLAVFIIMLIAGIVLLGIMFPDLSNMVLDWLGL